MRDPEHLRAAARIAYANRSVERVERQVAEGIPAHWSRGKSHSFRIFRGRQIADGIPPATPEQWEAGECRRKPGRRSERPEGWTKTEWKAYKGLKHYRKHAGLSDITPESYRAEHATVTPEVYEVTEAREAERKKKREAAVARVLRIAEQESRRARP